MPLTRRMPSSVLMLLEYVARPRHTLPRLDAPFISQARWVQCKECGGKSGCHRTCLAASFRYDLHLGKLHSGLVYREQSRNSGYRSAWTDSCVWSATDVSVLSAYSDRAVKHAISKPFRLPAEHEEEWKHIP